MSNKYQKSLDLLEISKTRRQSVAAHPKLNGIDYIEVVSEPEQINQRRLNVHFLKKSSEEGLNSLQDLLGLLDGKPGGFSIIPQDQARAVKVLKASRQDSHIVLDLDRAGDFSDYSLQILRPYGNAICDLLDPALAVCSFNFKAACKNRFDCKGKNNEAFPGAIPVIDYMAKDFASFKRALQDLMKSRFPEVDDYTDADLGIVMIELFSYAADMLSYYQDAISNEAYLGTARHRISVRRHARLIDYQMHDGSSARAIVQLLVSEEAKKIIVPTGTRILGKIDRRIGPSRILPGAYINSDLWYEALSAASVVFETCHEATIYERLNRIPIYDWGSETCSLSKGSTSVYLLGDYEDLIKKRDLLLLEEDQSQLEGQSKCQVVRITAVEKSTDPLLSSAEKPIVLTKVVWDEADALTFDLPVRKSKDGFSTGSASSEDQALSFASGNLVLADHGLGVKELHPSGQREANGIVPGKRAYRFYLQNWPVSRRLPLPDTLKDKAAAFLYSVSPKDAEPEIRIWATGTHEEEWKWKPDLLQSLPTDNHFVLETDNDGRALIRFGDGKNGRKPLEGTSFRIVCRLGLGERGNAGAGALAHVIPPDDLHLHSNESCACDLSGITAVRNPKAAWGGTEPEEIEQAKRLAPTSFYDQPLRAVIEEDYERAAQRHASVSKALARFEWTGSWFTVFVHVDPVGGQLSTELEDDLYEILRGQAIAGYDFKILPPKYVALDIEISVQAKDGYYKEHVEAAVREALCSGIDSCGQNGFFHPDNFTFGQTLYISELYAAVEKVTGVESAIVQRFQRLGRKSAGELESGRIDVDSLEILRLDNDRSHPEFGIIKIYMTGGL